MLSGTLCWCIRLSCTVFQCKRAQTAGACRYSQATKFLGVLLSQTYIDVKDHSQLMPLLITLQLVCILALNMFMTKTVHLSESLV